MKGLRLLVRFMKGNSLLYLGAAVSIFLASFFTTAIPMSMRTIIDSVIGNEPIDLPAWVLKIIEKLGGKTILAQNLLQVCFTIVFLTIGQGLFLFIKGKLAATASENSCKRMRDKIYNHLLHLPYDYHVKSQAGDLIQRCTSDIETVRNFVSIQLVEIVQILVTFVYVFFIMFSLNSVFTLISVILVPVILYFTMRFFIKMKKLFLVVDEAEGKMSSVLQENITGARVVRAFAAQNFEINKFDERSREYRDLDVKIAELMANFWSTSDLLCMLQFGIVLLVGIYLTASGSITIGTMVAFSTLAGYLIWPIRQLGQIFASMGQSFVSLERLQEILDEPPEKPESNEYEPVIKGDIEFRNVSFEYEAAKPVLNDISFSIKRGQTVAVLGSTGSGKSSLVHLLLRLYDHQKGAIYLDGVDIKNISKKWLRKNIGIVLQEPFLFSRSVRENIRISKKDVRDNEIFDASKSAALHDTIESFESGYDTMVGEKGVTLSGGQRQRMAIARTIIRDVPILIFDDSLSAVDIETDAEIRKSLKERGKNVTTIIISHRITTLAEADVIFVLDHGGIAQSGTHDELIQQEGLYKRIWKIQNLLEDELTQAVVEGG